MNVKSIVFICITLILISCTPTGTVPTMTAIPPTATITPTPSAGDTRIDAKGIEKVWVPAGSFIMGTDPAEVDALIALNPPAFVSGAMKRETLKHEVSLTKGYWIDKYEVTNKAFQGFVDAGGYTT